MIEFSLQRFHKVILLGLALSAVTLGVLIDYHSFLVNSLSAVVGFSAALLLAGPALRYLRRQSQLATAHFLTQVQTFIITPIDLRSQVRQRQVIDYLDRWGITGDDQSFMWVEDLESLAETRSTGSQIGQWRMLQEISDQGKSVFGRVTIGDLPESVASPFRVLLGFPDELEQLETSFPSAFDLVNRYEEDPAAAVRQLALEPGDWSDDLRQANAKAQIAAEATGALSRAINGYLQGLGTVMTDGDTRLHL